MTRTISLLSGGLLALGVVWGCSSSSPRTYGDDDSTSGSSNPGKGGTGTGGTVGSGGTAPGVGGASGSAGLASTGGTGNVSATGGATAGGAAGTGSAVGGSAGIGTGGTIANGGVGAIGAGGTVPAGGTGTSGSAGTGTAGDNPPGYWTYNDWHGCAWTGIDTDTTATVRTTIMPKDFTSGVSNGSYCVSGSVGNTYESVALLGFNLAQPATGTSCVYDPASASSMGPPGVTLGQTGLAVNFSKTGAFTLRVQIQGPNGATDETDRWCYTITDAAGPVFAPYNKFNTKCWDGTGTNYDGTKPISAVVFNVPGVKDTATPYNFCVNGFAAGNSAADAPTGGMMSGPLTGTIGGPGGTDLDFQRVKVKAGGKSYIVQNNNWGNPSGSNQTLTYKDNSFSVTQMDGSGSSAPASFPSIYIGANGDTQGGLYSTSSDDHLPIQVSSLTSLNTTFKYSLGSGQMNAAFDIWFSASKPTTCYADAISGFVMLWFHKPSNFMPIGSAGATVNIGGKSWVRWSGTRGGTGPSNGSCSVQNSNAPVISYVASSDITSWSGDVKPFLDDAKMVNSSYGSWYLTDIFGGFEIWSGGTGAAVQEFTAVVAP